MLARKLSLFGPLPENDLRYLDKLARNTRHLDARESIRSEGEAPNDIRVILSGFACRFKLVDTGDRQIVGYLVPGDFCDLHVFVLKAMDHNIVTMAKTIVVEIPRRDVLEMILRPALARALWWAALVDEAILREWLLNIGQRSADKRIAHLFCELHLRMKVMGLATDAAVALPISQAELADTMGLSAVHVSRALKTLRACDLLTFRNKNLQIHDLDRLRQFSDFTTNYLHLEATPKNQLFINQ